MISNRIITKIGILYAQYAEIADLEDIKTMFDANRKYFSFVTRTTIESSIRYKELIIIRIEGNIQAFCKYHIRKDRQVAIYDLYVSETYRHNGIARGILSLFNPPIIVKCPVKYHANAFYPKAGFRLLNIEHGRKTMLNVWVKT